MTVCAYCLTRRGHQKDHLLTKNQARRNVNAARERNNPRYIVPACHECNMAKYTRLRVPAIMPFLIAELEALTGDKYATFDGSAADLDATVRR